ncbi:MAG: putative phosphatase, C-terminal domain of histone macro like protein [Planctomycetaceae bacterium]|nr:putative phosphatase, C-terminal domain of histone macro like protein [Planctomycetaceae bacterium]
MRQFAHGAVELVLGNIVDQQTEAIVNAANTKLTGGGGVDGAIHRAAGSELKELCLQLPADEKGRRCQTGHVQTTTAGKLSAKYVIHAVGPYYNEQYAEKARDQLRQVHVLALQAALSFNCRSIAIPAISTGAYRFPITDAAKIAIDTVGRFLNSHTGIDLVRFVLYKQGQFDTFQSALDAWQLQTGR